jgi:hypothetical protein
MADSKQDQETPGISVNIDGKATPILYTDTVYVGSNEFGVVLDFAQRLGPSNQQQVVGRMGMSVDHARKMIEVIQDHLEKHER